MLEKNADNSTSLCSGLSASKPHLAIVECEITGVRNGAECLEAAPIPGLPDPCPSCSVHRMETLVQKPLSEPALCQRRKWKRILPPPNSWLGLRLATAPCCLFLATAVSRGKGRLSLEKFTRVLLFP